MSETTTAKPYLSELESVTVAEPLSRYVSWIAMVLFGAIIGAVVTFTYALVRYYLGPGWPEWRGWLPIGVVVSVIAVYFLAGTCWLHYVWSTDSMGITTRGLRSSRSVGWSDITSVEMSQSDSGMVCKVFMGRKKLTLATVGQGGIALFASVYQYAQQYRIPVRGQFSPLIESLWTPISDSVPQEMDWHNPKAIDPHTAVTAITLGCLLILAAAYAIYRLGYGEQLYKYSSHAMSGILGGLIGLFHTRFQTAQCVSVRMDRFEAETAICLIDMPWSEIESAQIVKNNLVVRCGGPLKTVLIPCDVSSDDCVQVVLSIIRRLRSSEKPVPVLIPEPLASVKYLTRPVERKLDVAEDDFVETRIPWVLIVAPLVILVFAAVVYHIMSNFEAVPRVARVIVWVLVLQALFLFYYMRSRYTRVDSAGITTRMLWNTKFVSWSEVASYSVEHRTEPAVSVVYRLKDSSGKILTSIVCNNRTADCIRLNAYVDNMLSRVPREEHKAKSGFPFGG